MSSLVGKERPISAATLADGLKGLIWGLEIDGVMYDIEFTGKLSGFGDHIVKVKKKSTKQRKS